MRMWLSERDGKLWCAALQDDEHPCTQEEFAWRCGSNVQTWSEKTATDVLERAARQIQEYFTGARMAFDIPLDLTGSDFQMRVWQELTRIPFGEVRSYGEVAETIGKAKAPRAVGRANGSNRLPVFVPCHRIIASGGKLGGFTGGIGLKKRLLDHELAVLGYRMPAAAQHG